MCDVVYALLVEEVRQDAPPGQAWAAVEVLDDMLAEPLAESKVDPQADLKLALRLTA